MGVPFTRISGAAHHPGTLSDNGNSTGRSGATSIVIVSVNGYPVTLAMRTLTRSPTTALSTDGP